MTSSGDVRLMHLNIVSSVYQYRNLYFVQFFGLLLFLFCYLLQWNRITLFWRKMFLLLCLMNKYFSFISCFFSRLKSFRLQVCHSTSPTLYSANTRSGINWSQLLLHPRWILPYLPSARSHGAWLSSITAMYVFCCFISETVGRFIIAQQI